ncbi:hypothetical protein G3I44_06900 [Halogeometricum borinquense]|uniref:Uncharacterized protein n=1 Tax=Halogeometricum borinquense TaxID=60847 RepID=A0A6C0UF31_9EURY|nr:hypothetical protein [Halogeometricum borinquense]QIB74046.1 hypothetical protein G3I44_06900 [Halogeometricum borinquense]
MGATFLLVVPEEEETLETAKQFYRYHVQNSEHDDDLEGVFEYEQVKKRLEQEIFFMVYKKPTTAVVDAGEPSMQEVQYKYEDDDHVVRDPEGLNQFIQSLETARENLQRDGDLFEGKDRTIEMCINLIEFAKKNGYGISF